MKMIFGRCNVTIAFVFIGIVCFVLPSMAFAGDIVAIVNKDNGVSSLSLKELEHLFKGKTKEWSSGEGVELFLPDTKSKAMQALAANVFKRKNGLAVSKFYLRAVFQQKFPSVPQKAGSTDDAVDSVASTPGGIAVVDAGEISDTSSIKILKVGGL